ncbi:DUF2061 domain-containing protein [bacterium]|nr:DUF2061 domain-containing protein [bacterium]
MANFHKRTFVKGLTWEGSGFITLFLISYVITNEALTASIFSIGYTVLRVLMFYLHERIWKKTAWGKPILKDNE